MKRLLVILLIIAGCQNSPEPVGYESGPSTQLGKTALSMHGHTGLSEAFDLRPVFEGSGESELASQAIFLGEVFGLVVEQSFDPQTRIVSLIVSIENKTSVGLWRPLILEVQALKPASAKILTADNDLSEGGAMFSYGQQLGMDGQLAPGDRTTPRDINIQMQGKSEASLNSLRISVLVTADPAPALLPTPTRDPSSEEAAEQIGLGILRIQYVDGILDDDLLERINVKYGLSGQEYDPLLEHYIAFLTQPSKDATLATRDKLAVDSHVSDVTIVNVFTLSDIDEDVDGHVAVQDFHLNLAGLPSGWNEDFKAGRDPGQDVRIGILDSGIDLDHPQLRDQIDLGIDVRFLAKNDPWDRFGHGTSVAGVIAASSAPPAPIGVAFGIKIVSIKITNGSHLFDWNVHRGLRFLRDNPDISIANLSFSGPPFIASLPLISEIPKLEKAGTVLIAATGNNNSQSILWPASANEVIAVGGTDNTTGTSRWSNPPLGSNVGNAVEFCAPATNILTTALGGNYRLVTGTSFAAPQVTAVAAILQARDPNVSGAALRQALQNVVVDIGPSGRDTEFGFGRIRLPQPVPQDTWIPINNGLTDLNIRSIAVDPSNSTIIYVGTTSGVFKSVDGGNSWNASSNGFMNLNIQDMVIDAENSNILYAGTGQGGVHKSSDAGNTWIPINTGLPTLFVPAVAVHLQNSSIVYCGPDGSGIYRSTNGGSSWSLVGSFRDTRSLALTPANPSVVYAATVFSVRKSSNDGASWSFSGSGLPNPFLNGLTVDSNNESVVYSGPDRQGVWKTTNGGSNWFSTNNGIPTGTHTVIALAVNPNNSNVVYAGIGGLGVFRSADGGSSWTEFNEGLTNLSIGRNSLTIDPGNPNTLYVGTSGDGIFQRVTSD